MLIIERTKWDEHKRYDVCIWLKLNKHLIYDVSAMRVSVVHDNDDKVKISLEFVQFDLICDTLKCVMYILNMERYTQILKDTGEFEVWENFKISDVFYQFKKTTAHSSKKSHC